MQAYSYSWWKFVDKRGPLVVFNDFGYSNTTRRHQYKVRRLLNQLGIQIHATIEAPNGLQSLDSAIHLYERRIETLKAEIAKPRSRKAKNVERMQAIKEMQAKIKQVKALMKFKVQS